MSVIDDNAYGECGFCDELVELNLDHCMLTRSIPLHAECCKRDGTHECETHRPEPELVEG